MELDDSSTRLRSEETLQAKPNITSNGVTDDLSYEVIKKEGNKSTKNELVNLGPSKKGRIRSKIVEMERWRKDGRAVDKVEELLPFEVGDHLSTPKKKVVVGEFNQDKVGEVRKNGRGGWGRGF